MKVSVITTAWNTAPWIDYSIDSICSSTHTDIEVILVDDGSTDGTTDKAAAWAERDDRVVFRSLDRRHGRNAALKAAHGLATGQLLCWVDSDDIVHETGIERCVEVIDADHEVATTMRRMIDPDGNDLGVDRRFNGAVPSLRVHFWHHLRMFTSDLFDRAGGVGERRAAIDTDMNMRFAEHTEAVFIAECLYSQRYRPGRMTGGTLQRIEATQARRNASRRRQSRKKKSDQMAMSNALGSPRNRA